MNCIYCDNDKLYTLKTGQLKCCVCKKKFSPRKIKKELDVIRRFCNDYSANQTAKDLKINYVTVQKRYETFRKMIANFLEDEYKNKNVIEYDEYVYLPKSKKKIKENIFDAQNFLTFNYDDRVYNLLMPNLKTYKNQFIADGAKEAYFKEFSKFMMINKISKTHKRENVITKFWLFFEESILKYKGVSDDNFIYYVKEIEFKFNYSKQTQEDTLKNLRFQY